MEQSHSAGSVAVALTQALAVRDDAALSTVLEGECDGVCRSRHPALAPPHVLGPPLVLLFARSLLAAERAHWPALLLLAVADAAIIAASTAKLSSSQAVALLEALVQRLQQRPQQAARLAPWLRSLLLTHGAVLAAAPAGQVRGGRQRGGRGRKATGSPPPPVLAFAANTIALSSPATFPLLLPQAILQLAHQLLEERTASFGPLLSLSGRLQVLQPAAAGAAAPPAATAAKVVFSAV